MKVVYVGDNRNRGNYGCRATSTALSMLISQDHEVVARISGELTCSDIDYLFYYPKLPAWVYKWVKNSPLRKSFVRVMCAIFNIKKGDYVSLDMEKSWEEYTKCLPANASLSGLDFSKIDFDALVVNGEGSFIFYEPAWRETLVLMMLMYRALKEGKKVFFMNAMFSDSPYTPRNYKTIKIAESILSRCQCVVAREQVSMQYLKDVMPSVHAVLFPDALFTWNHYIQDPHKVINGRYYLPRTAAGDEAFSLLDFSKPYILVSASSSILDHNMSQVIESYSYLVNICKERYNGAVYLIQTCEGDAPLNEIARCTNTAIVPMDFPILAAAKVLANARAFISGRYHPAVLASQGGTPCVFMSSNSHKTYSLQELLQYDVIKEFSCVPSHEECDEMIGMALEYILQGDGLRNRILHRTNELSTVAEKMTDLLF